MKRILLFIAALFVFPDCRAQSVVVDYFGQKPPGEIPIKFAPGIISKENRYELMSAFSANGKEFCFTVTNEQWSHFEIWYSKFELNKWSAPKVIPFLPSSGAFGPVFSPDGASIFFSSANWVTHPSTIWYSTRKKSGWGGPVKLPAPVNSVADQWQFSIAKDGTLLFTSNRPGGKGGYDLYMAERVNGKYDSAVNVTALNSAKDEYSAFIAPDKSYIIFSSQRNGGYGWDDLYISFRKKDKTWSPPITLGPRINTTHAEFSTQVSPDGKYLFYSKWDVKNKWSDIYWVRIDKCIERLKKQSRL
jgi:Tol biopolymer transport system component